MATRDWPALPAYTPRSVRPGVLTPKAAYVAAYTGQVQQLGHAADRYRITLTLPPCSPQDGQHREAFFGELVSTGDWVRLPYLHRLVPLGTLRGLPVVAFDALAGARTLNLTTTPGATLAAGDVLATGQQVVMVASAGAVANGAGAMAVPLVLPLVQTAPAGAAVLWQQPTGTFQLTAVDGLDFEYARHQWQAALELSFLQAA